MKTEDEATGRTGTPARQSVWVCVEASSEPQLSGSLARDLTRSLCKFVRHVEHSIAPVTIV